MLALLRKAARGRPLTKEQTAHLKNLGLITTTEDGTITITRKGGHALNAERTTLS